MKALTIKQPWVDAIVQPSRSPKRVENRTWPAPTAHIGALLDKTTRRRTR